MSIIRLMNASDRVNVLQMMKDFYSSSAVLSSGSQEIFMNDIDCCISDSPYLEGYVFEESGKIQGYAMVAKSFSTEFGSLCVWLEDIYVKTEYRGLGIGGEFLRFIQKKYAGSVFRLEVERENAGAVKLYEKNGFAVLPYMEMKK